MDLSERRGGGLQQCLLVVRRSSLLHVRRRPLRIRGLWCHQSSIATATPFFLTWHYCYLNSHLYKWSVFPSVIVIASCITSRQLFSLFSECSDALSAMLIIAVSNPSHTPVLTALAYCRISRDIVSVLNVSVSRRSRDVFWNVSYRLGLEGWPSRSRLGLVT